MAIPLGAEEGLSPLAALRTVALNPAKPFALADSLSTIVLGKLADVVLLDANPLTDIANAAAVGIGDMGLNVVEEILSSHSLL